MTSNKMPLAWHRDRLTYMRDGLEDELVKIERARRNYDRLAGDITELAAQIARAESENLDGFDADRFMRRRVK